MIPIGETSFLFEELDYLMVEMVKEDGKVVGIGAVFSSGREELFERTE